MAVGEIIGAAIGILMLIIVAYLVVGNTLSTAELITNAQKEVTSSSELRLRTATTLYLPFSPSGATGTFNFSINNTGQETISDFAHMDLFSANSSTGSYLRYAYHRSGNTAGTWTIERITPDFIHPMMLDPGESMWVCATYSGDAPVWTLVSTGNGVYASGTLP